MVWFMKILFAFVLFYLHGTVSAFNGELPIRSPPVPTAQRRQQQQRPTSSPVNISSVSRPPSTPTFLAAGGPAVAAASSRGAIGLLNAFFKNYPYASSFLVTGIKAGFADAIAQASEPGSFLMLRNLVFLLYGGLYQGCTQYFLYNKLFPKLFGVSTAPTVVAKKVLTDLLVLTPFLCLPSVYFLKSLVFRYSPVVAAKKYWTDVKDNGVVFKYWILWCPVQCLTFGVIPEHLRISFIALISFFWLIILSKITSKSDATSAAKKD